MKRFKCYDCEAEFQAETRAEILDQLYEHYVNNHKAAMENATEVEKKAWMVQFEKDWVAAKEV